jgi:hypothetical protein
MAEGGGGGIGGILQGILGSLLGGVDSNIQLAFDYTAAWLNNLLHNLVGLFKAIGGFFSALWKFLKQAWENYIKKALDWLIKHFKKWIDWLRLHIKKLLDFLKKVKKWYDTHILPQQKRMLAMIQDVRRFLGILRLFHVKWAAKLDASLADLQNRIEESIAFVRGTLNQIINTLAIAFDPSLLITSNVLAGSLLGNLAAVKRIFMYGSNRIISATEQATMDFNRTRYQKQNVQSHMATLASTGPTQQDLAERTQSRSALAAATGAPLPF